MINPARNQKHLPQKNRALPIKVKPLIKLPSTQKNHSVKKQLQLEKGNNSFDADQITELNRYYNYQIFRSGLFLTNEDHELEPLLLCSPIPLEK